MAENQGKRFIITKKVAKHGKQAIIVIPRVLEEHLPPGTIVEVSINVLEGIEGGENGN
jgi:hypothetical protein